LKSEKWRPNRVVLEGLNFGLGLWPGFETWEICINQVSKRRHW